MKATEELKGIDHVARNHGNTDCDYRSAVHHPEKLEEIQARQR